MAIAKLSIDIEARLANLQAGLDKAGLLAERTANQISGAFSGLKSVAATVGPALAAVFAVAGIVGFVRQTLDGIDALNDLSDATGASIENLSALEDAAARTGTQMDTVGAALIKLKRYDEAMADIDKGIGLGQTYEHVGYYNRGVAEFFLGRITQSYYDFKKASEIAPEFTPAREQLKNFVVTRVPAGQEGAR